MREEVRFSITLYQDCSFSFEYFRPSFTTANLKLIANLCPMWTSLPFLPFEENHIQFRVLKFFLRLGNNLKL